MLRYKTLTRYVYSRTEYPKCSLVSLANNFPPHQLARRAEFQATLPVVSEAIRSTVEVVGDLLAWHIDHGHGQEGETFVVNWNSGVVVWVRL